MADAQSLVDQVDSQIGDLQSSASEAITALQDAAALPYLSWFDFSSTVPPTLLTPGKVTLGDIPAFQAPHLDAAPTFALDIAMFDTLEAKVMDIVNSGGQNIAPAVQDAVFNQGIERLKQTEKDALDLTGAKTGAKGFRYPNSMTKALQKEIALNFVWTRSDLSRTIVKEFADMAQRNLQMAISAGVEIERAQADIAIKAYTVALEGERLVYEKYKVQVESAVEVYSAELKGALAQLEADMDNAKLTVEAQGQVIDLFRVTSNNTVEKGRSQIAQAEEANRLKMTAIKGLVDAYIGMIQNMSAQAVAVVTKKT